MLKRILSTAAVLILLVSLFSGCGAGSRQSSAKKSVTGIADMAPAAADVNAARAAGKTAAAPAAPTAAPQPAGGSKAESAYDMLEKPASADAADGATALTGSGSANQSLGNAILAQRKIIRNANVTIEVENFDIAYGKINTFINGIGYIQETNIKKDKVYVEEELKLITNGVIIIRVDKDKFDQVMNDIRGIGVLLDQQIKTDDVTEKYFDIEARLRLLKYEESRLEDYLKTLSDPDTIFKTQSRLTDIRHEIESLTGTLRKLGDLTELSTITINLNEKNPAAVPVPVPKPKNYGQKLLGNFMDSIRGVISFLGELLILIVQAIPVLLLLGAFALAVLKIYKRVGKVIKPGDNRKDNDSQM